MNSVDNETTDITRPVLSAPKEVNQLMQTLAGPSTMDTTNVFSDQEYSVSRSRSQKQFAEGVSNPKFPALKPSRSSTGV